MQTVSPRFKEVVYSGDARYSCYLTINNNTVDMEEISSIIIKSPIVDTTQQTFYIGTFISQRVDIKFRNISKFDVKTGDIVELTIGLKVDNIIEPVKIGTFIIDELASDYQNTNQISCLDYGIKFMQTIDYSELITEEKPTVTIEEILQFICQKVNVELGYYPETNKNIETSASDNTISAKQYVSWIAELMGGNAKIDRNGVLNIIPLNDTPVEEIDIRSAQEFSVKEKYKISKITYFDALRNFSYPENEEFEGNTLIIRQSNFFISDQSQVEELFNAIGGFEVYSVRLKNRGDISLDSWDIVSLTDGTNSYKTFNDNTITYQMIISTVIETNIPTKQQEITTINYNSMEDKVNRVWTEVDNINHRTLLLSQNTYTKEDIQKINSNIFDDYILTTDSTYQDQVEYYKLYNEQYVLLQKGVDYEAGQQIVGNRYIKKAVNVSYVLTEQGMFSDEGLRIEKLSQDRQTIISDTSTLLNEVGLTVNRVDKGKIANEKPLLYSGYVNKNNPYYGDEYAGQSITATQVIKVNKWLTIGNKSRMEEYKSDGVTKTGVFPIGE